MFLFCFACFGSLSSGSNRTRRVHSGAKFSTSVAKPEAARMSAEGKLASTNQQLVLHVAVAPSMTLHWGCIGRHGQSWRNSTDYVAFPLLSTSVHIRLTVGYLNMIVSIFAIIDWITLNIVASRLHWMQKNNACPHLGGCCVMNVLVGCRASRIECLQILFPVKRRRCSR